MLESPVRLSAPSDVGISIVSDLLSGHRDSISEDIRLFLATVFESSPFLHDCARKEPQFLFNILLSGFESGFVETISEVKTSGRITVTETDLMRQLRVAKRKVALLCGLADLGGWWKNEKVTEALSEFAEISLSAALDFLLLQQHNQGTIKLANLECPQQNCGIIVLGMGKLGAGELNYSSDIDLITFFDDRAGIKLNHDDPITSLNRFAKQLIKIMQERTEDGYVFRMDLRLRPDPSSTPLIIPVEAALNYYEGQGQNWERSAMIKAHPVAGDKAAAEEFLKELEPFIWRKYLDFSAINDVHSIKRQIHAHKGHGEIAVYGHNIKLGRGGIREIEFFAQTQQLIAGGRNNALRKRETIAALEELCNANWIERSTVTELTEAYWFLRAVEHRVQMIRDEQIHVLPENERDLLIVATLSGFYDLNTFMQAIQSTFETVEKHYSALFESAPELSGAGGNLVFTGDDLDPGTIKTLTDMGYQRPEQIILIVKGWHVAKVPALRATQARELLTELIPFLLETFARTEKPDEVIFAFDRFLMGLPAGIQLFSILKNNPALTNLIVKILDSAPRLAEQIARSPHVFDSMLEPGQPNRLLSKKSLEEAIKPVAARAGEFELFLDAMRRFASEMRFEIGTRFFNGQVKWQQAASQFSAVAEVVIGATFNRVVREFEQTHGKIEGASVCILAMGRLGSRELTSTSDLDLIFLYHLDDTEAESNGERPLDPVQYFIRLLKRFITAVTVPTAEGTLYSLDFRLRPSGNAGPLATTVESFFKYQENEAWVWEAQALTRARPVYGDIELCKMIQNKCASVLSNVRNRHEVLSEIGSMRERILKEKGSKDIWDLKNVSGGLIDIEFLAQACVLLRPEALAGVTATDEILLSEASGELFGSSRDILVRAFDIFSNIIHLQRICLWDASEKEEFPAGFKAALCQRLDLPSFAACEAELGEQQKAVRSVFRDFVT